MQRELMEVVKAVLHVKEEKRRAKRRAEKGRGTAAEKEEGSLMLRCRW
jgi:hypothetical protein